MADSSKQDQEPRETLFRGVDGCPHLHYSPNVTPRGCGYCGSRPDVQAERHGEAR